MKRPKLLLALLVFCYLPLRSLAWGQTGHRVVGQIADAHLTAKAKAEIARLLGNESVAMASNWADFVKSDSNYKYLDRWHYVNFEKGLSYEQFRDVLKKDTAVDAYTKLNFLIGELKKKMVAKETKAMYLRLLIHIVGDIHQPLHVSPLGTTGGNDIKVQWFNTPSNLHRVWDTDLIDQQQLSYTEWARHLDQSTLKERKALQSTPMSRWFYESYSLAQDLHNEIREPNQRLGYPYNYVHLAQLNTQLLKGGIRLAGLINSIFA